MYCPNCGASVDQNTLYCMSCGFPIVSGSQDTSSEFAETESFSEAYEETGKLDENGFTPIDANVVGGVPFSDKQALNKGVQTHNRVRKSPLSCLLP